MTDQMELFHVDKPEKAPNAGTLVAEWIDHCAMKPPSRVIGQVSKYIKELLEEGVPYEHVRRGLALWTRQNRRPAALHETVYQAMNGEGKSTTTERVSAGMKLVQKFGREEGYFDGQDADGEALDYGRSLRPASSW